MYCLGVMLKHALNLRRNELSERLALDASSVMGRFSRNEAWMVLRESPSSLFFMSEVVPWLNGRVTPTIPQTFPEWSRSGFLVVVDQSTNPFPLGTSSTRLMMDLPVLRTRISSFKISLKRFGGMKCSSLLPMMSAPFWTSNISSNRLLNAT